MRTRESMEAIKSADLPSEASAAFFSVKTQRLAGTDRAVRRLSADGGMPSAERRSRERNGHRPPASDEGSRCWNDRQQRGKEAGP